MKKFVYFIAIAIIALCACSKIDEPTTSKVEYVEVSVEALVNGVKLVSETPLTRAATSSNDVYGIQIFRQNDWGQTYFCGIYDDITLLDKIKFVKGETYGIYSTYIPNAKSYIENIGTTDYAARPFCLILDYSGYYNQNALVFNEGYYAINVRKRMEAFAESNPNMPDKDIYMCVNTEFVANENASLELDYLRYNANLVLNFTTSVNNINKVKVTCSEDYWSKTIDIINGQGVYEITNYALNHWQHTEPSLRFVISNEDKSEIFYDGDITLKRNVTRTYEVNLDNIGTDSDVVVSYENTGFTEENGGALN